MERFIGTKLIEAEPCSLKDFNTSKGQPHSNTLPDAAGYKVLYEDGYVSWSPAGVFEAAYKKNGELTFGMALEAVKKGFLIARSRWNGMFVFMRPADSIPAQVVIENVKSLPQAVKDYYNQKYKGDYEMASGGTFKIDFTSYLCMKAADDSIVNGWSASQTDMQANDWEVL